MNLNESHDYPATPDAVWEMLADAAWREQVCAATGATSWDVVIDADECGGTIGVTRVMPADVPGALRKIVGDTVTVTQTETWGPATGDGSRQSEVELLVLGQPAVMTGSSTLAPCDAGTRQLVSAELEVRMPLVGGALEKELAKAITLALRKEHEVGQAYLA